MSNFLVFLNMLMDFSLKVALITVHCSNHLFWFSRQNVALDAFLSSWRAISLKRNSDISVEKSEVNPYFAIALSLYVKLSVFLNMLMNFTLKVA